MQRTSYNKDSKGTSSINRISTEVYDLLETAFRHLLLAALNSLDDTLDEESTVGQRLDFEVCLDGNIYTVYIVQSHPTVHTLYPRLSPREREIVWLISKGMSNKAIALALSLRPSTVSSYTKRIFLKLKVNSRAEMVANVLNTGLLDVYPLHESKLDRIRSRISSPSFNADSL
jgi:DNA-binding CsgD family transcriptional regulator